MEESIKKVVELKTDGYGLEEKNFAIAQELTVSITLSEYRKLVQEVATKAQDVSEARSARWEAEAEVKVLKEEISELNRSLANASMYGPRTTTDGNTMPVF